MDGGLVAEVDQRVKPTTDSKCLVSAVTFGIAVHPLKVHWSLLTHLTGVFDLLFLMKTDSGQRHTYFCNSVQQSTFGQNFIVLYPIILESKERQ